MHDFQVRAIVINSDFKLYDEHRAGFKDLLSVSLLVPVSLLKLSSHVQRTQDMSRRM